MIIISQRWILRCNHSDLPHKNWPAPTICTSHNVRLICRIFERLDLIQNREQLLSAVIQGRKFAEATGHPIRYIDIVFVTYGQVKSQDLGIEKGICIEKNPSCDICGVRYYCIFYSDSKLTINSEG